MNKLYEYAFKRKSFRRFRSELKLSNAELIQTEKYIDNEIISINDKYTYKYKIVPRKETICKSGEYCILIYSKIDGPHLLNVGYCFEQLDLYLSSIDIGACWYGMGKVEEYLGMYQEYDYVIMIAIGKACESEFRKNYRKAKRKDSSDIWFGKELKDIVDYIKYAPSTCNSQPWEMTYHNDIIIIKMKSKEKMLVPKNKISYYNSIDIGTIMLFIELWFEKNNIKYEREITEVDVLYKSTDVIVTYKLYVKTDALDII